MLISPDGDIYASYQHRPTNIKYLVHDRDTLAATNILDFAFHKQNLIQYRVGLTQINAQGDDKITEQKCLVVV